MLQYLRYFYSWFSTEYLENKKVLGVQIEGDESKTTREPVSLQIGKKNQYFLHAAHRTVRRAFCGKVSTELTDTSLCKPGWLGLC